MKNISNICFTILFTSIITLANSNEVAAGNKKPTKPNANWSSQTKQWEQQPFSFMGMKLLEPLSESVTVECPKGPIGLVDSQKADSLGKLCHNDFILKETGSYIIYGFQVEPIFREAYVKTMNGKLDGSLAKIQTNFNSSDYSKVKDMFMIKYGPPHNKEYENLKTKGGAEFGNEVLTWSGDKVIIKIQSLSSRGFDNGSIYEHGVIDVYTNEFINKAARESENAAQRSATGL